MNTIITDGGKYEISKKVANLLRSLFIKQFKSEPYHQHQNRAEHQYPREPCRAPLTVGYYVFCMPAAFQISQHQLPLEVSLPFKL